MHRIGVIPPRFVRRVVKAREQFGQGIVLEAAQDHVAVPDCARIARLGLGWMMIAPEPVDGCDSLGGLDDPSLERGLERKVGLDPIE
jgi:hypothetical protein